MKKFVLMIYTYDDINLSQVLKSNGVETRIFSREENIRNSTESWKSHAYYFWGLTLLHSPPDLALSDFHLLGLWKNLSEGRDLKPMHCRCEVSGVSLASRLRGERNEILTEGMRRVYCECRGRLCWKVGKVYLAISSIRLSTYWMTLVHPYLHNNHIVNSQTIKNECQAE